MGDLMRSDRGCYEDDDGNCVECGAPAIEHSTTATTTRRTITIDVEHPTERTHAVEMIGGSVDVADTEFSHQITQTFDRLLRQAGKTAVLLAKGGRVIYWDTLRTYYCAPKGEAAGLLGWKMTTRKPLT